MNSSHKGKTLLFSVTAADCRFDYLRGSGAGGQKRNKTESAVRCTHIASKAVGYSEETRSQHDNKRAAFERMAGTKEFKQWHKLEVSRKTGKLDLINREVEKQMRNIRVEVKNEKGLWIEVDKNASLDADLEIRCISDEN